MTMGYYDILAERSGRLSTLDELKKYEGDDVYVTFSDLPKLGINPKNKFNTPTGVYAYPLQYVIDNNGEVPFAGNRNYLVIFKASGNIVDGRTYTEDDWNRDKDKLKTILKLDDFDTWPGHILKSLYNTITGAAKKFGRENNLQKTSAMTRLFRLLGYDGILDWETGILPSEPVQAVFFNPRTISIIGLIKNRINKSRLYSLDYLLKNPHIIQNIINNGGTISYDPLPKWVDDINVEKVDLINTHSALRLIRDQDNSREAYTLLSRLFTRESMRDLVFDTRINNKSVERWYDLGLFDTSDVQRYTGEDIAFPYYKLRRVPQALVDMDEAIATNIASQANYDFSMFEMLGKKSKGQFKSFFPKMMARGEIPFDKNILNDISSLHPNIQFGKISEMLWSAANAKNLEFLNLAGDYLPEDSLRAAITHYGFEDLFNDIRGKIGQIYREVNS